MHKLLLIDHSKRFAQKLEEVCPSYGWDLEVANQGKAGLEKAWEVLPSALVIRCELPGISGFALLNIIRKNPRLREIPVALISDIIDEQVFHQHEKLTTHARAYFAKNYEPKDVMDWADATLESSKDDADDKTTLSREEFVEGLRRISADPPKLGGIPPLLIVFVLLLFLSFIIYTMIRAFLD